MECTDTLSQGRLEGGVLMPKNYRWKCFKCGYRLPEKSDLLKICPECGAFGEFVKEAGF